ALDRRVATDVEEDRAAGPEGRELLVTVGDAPRPTALIPAARLLDQPAAPKREPLLFYERSLREALELDAAREAEQLRPRAGEQLDPGSDEPFVGSIVDGGKDAIRRIRATLVGGLEGNGGGQWLRELERGRVVERLDVDPGEEAGRVGRLARLSERARGERRLPACGRQCAGKRARHLRRAAAGEEEEGRDDEAA